MIRDLSESIGDLLRASAPFAAVDILFERPISQFEPERTTVDVFLYDIRGEMMELRKHQPIREGTGPLRREGSRAHT